MQKSVLKNIKIFYEAGEEVVKIIKDFYAIPFEANYTSIHERKKCNKIFSKY